MGFFPKMRLLLPEADMGAEAQMVKQKNGGGIHCVTQQQPRAGGAAPV